MKKIIYDLGANNGDDIPYYLKKADLVVAVEANPDLCRQIEKRFANEIEQKSVVVENFVVTDGTMSGDVLFYPHKFNHVLSQLPMPNDITQFEEMLLPSKSVMELISTHGDPYYIKIDIEHYDAAILRALFTRNISPPYISAESHSTEVFALLVALGKYNAFKLVEGTYVAHTYRQHTITTRRGPETYSFPRHSSGPFGDDIPGHWMTADNFFRLLAFVNLGWKDIHATNVNIANANAVVEINSEHKVMLNCDGEILEVKI